MRSPLPRRIRAHNHRVGETVRSVSHRVGEAIQSPWRRDGGSGRSLWRGIEAVGFWMAVLLPLAYPAALIGGGLLSGSWTPLVVLLAAHALALVVGRGHGRRKSEGRTDGE